MSANQLSSFTREHFALSFDDKNDLIQDPTDLNSIAVVHPDLTADQHAPLATPLSDSVASIKKIGNFLLLPPQTTTSASSSHLEAVDISTQQHFTCKVVPLSQYQGLVSLYSSVTPHPSILPIHHVLLGASSAYLLLPKHHGDLHSYVRSVKRLGEAEAKRLFGQIVGIVEHCHEHGVVLRDIKLRKFVFKDANRTQLMLESLDDARLLSDCDYDLLSDRQGCPAYVSPEILSESQSMYSGRAADVWSLGVVLYTMLLGRYPFQDSDPVSLFRAIRHARYSLPRHLLSPLAQCLLRWMLRCVPAERPHAVEITRHPWFSSGTMKACSGSPYTCSNSLNNDSVHSGLDTQKCCSSKFVAASCLLVTILYPSLVPSSVPDLCHTVPSSVPDFSVIWIYSSNTQILWIS